MYYCSSQKVLHFLHFLHPERPRQTGERHPPGGKERVRRLLSSERSHFSAERSLLSGDRRLPSDEFSREFSAAEALQEILEAPE